MGFRERMRVRGVSGTFKDPRVEGKQTTLKAPAVFSVMENTEEMLDFFSRLRSARSENHQVFIDLKDVKQITIDGVLLLLSKIQERTTGRGVSVGGNEPLDEEVRTVFAQSGFYDYVTHRPASYKRGGSPGVVKRHEGKRVHETVCAELVQHATQTIYGARRKQGGLYRVLIECMANTRDHAKIGSVGREAWWVAVYHDSKTGIAHFAFLDNGVGVFRSGRMVGYLRQLGDFLKLNTYPDLLRDILDAKLGSRTGLPYRGKGLPAIKRALDRGQLRNLKIVTNGAYLNAAERQGRSLRREFRGTCLTWEIHRE